LNQRLFSRGVKCFFGAGCNQAGAEGERRKAAVSGEDEAAFVQAPEGGISCAQCRALLSEFTDHELTPEETAAVRRHLETCKLCAQDSAEYGNLKKAVAAWDGVSGSNAFRARVVETMIRESQQLSGGQMAAAAAAAKAAGDASGERYGPPVWLLLAAGALAAGAYYLLQWLRGS
jgi:anti-sigma factor RsiW